MPQLKHRIATANEDVEMMNDNSDGNHLHDCSYDDDGWKCSYNDGTVHRITLHDMLKDLTLSEKRQLLDDIRMR
jgi:hypothetical protein